MTVNAKQEGLKTKEQQSGSAKEILVLTTHELGRKANKTVLEAGKQADSTGKISLVPMNQSNQSSRKASGTVLKANTSGPEGK